MLIIQIFYHKIVQKLSEYLDPYLYLTKLSVTLFFLITSDFHTYVIIMKHWSRKCGMWNGLMNDVPLGFDHFATCQSDQVFFWWVIQKLFTRPEVPYVRKYVPVPRSDTSHIISLFMRRLCGSARKFINNKIKDGWFMILSARVVVPACCQAVLYAPGQNCADGTSDSDAADCQARCMMCTYCSSC